MTSSVNVESLSIIRSFGRLEIHITYESMLLITHTALDLIDIANTKLLITWVDTKRYLKS